MEDKLRDAIDIIQGMRCNNPLHNKNKKGDLFSNLDIRNSLVIGSDSFGIYLRLKDRCCESFEKSIQQKLKEIILDSTSL